MLSPASPPGPALGPALREGLKLGPGPSPTFKARARPKLVFLGPDPSLVIVFLGPFGLITDSTLKKQVNLANR